MALECEKFTDDIISLKRPTGLDKLGDKIPKPKGAVPNFGLPKWRVMPLESKIPMVPGPKGAYNFTRSKVGKELWIPSEDVEFNLSDPYCYEMEMPYDSLHDKHLVPYFSRPNNVQHLIKIGLITKDLDAKCSLRDYNMYRKYLRRLHCDSIKKELNKKERLAKEEKAIMYAQEQAEKEVRKLQEREKVMERRKGIIRDRIMAEELKLQKQREKQQKTEERLTTLIHKRQEARYLQFVKSKARTELIQQKRKAAAEIEREKFIRTLVEWSRKERIRKETGEMRLKQERERKQQKVEHKWAERLEFQKKQIEKEQFLLQCIEDRRNQFITSYNEKINMETERMKRLFRDIRMHVRCYMARYMPGKKSRICCKKLSENEQDEGTWTSRPSIKQDRDKATSRRIDGTYNTQKTQKTLRKGTRESFSSKRRKEVSTVSKRGKRRRKGRRRRKRKMESTAESKSELEALEESLSSTKTTESFVSTSTDTAKDMCKCQAIKDRKKITT